MEIENIFYIILYLTIFLSILMYIVLFYNRQNIIDNWDKYKCNPLVFPFASFFGKNSNDSINVCLLSNFTTMFNNVFKPFNLVATLITSILSEISIQINFIRNILKPIRIFIQNITGTIYKKIEGIVSLTYMSYLKMENITNRVLSNFRLLVYSLEASQFMVSSTFNGPIMDVANFWAPSADFFTKKFCFSSNTLISTKYGNKYINNIQIGDYLTNNSMVIGILSFINLDKLVDVYGINVSKYHIIYKNGVYSTCEGYSYSRLNSDIVYCLNTNNGHIPVVNRDNTIELFKDYDEVRDYSIVSKFRMENYNLNGIKYSIVCKDNPLCMWNVLVSTQNGKKFISTLKIGDKLDNDNVVIGVIVEFITTKVYNNKYTGSVIVNNSVIYNNGIFYSGIMYNICTSKGYYYVDCDRVIDFSENLSEKMVDNFRKITLEYLNTNNH